MALSLSQSPLASPAERLAQYATDWWADQHRPALPGQRSGYTVFVISFYDGCRHFGYTQEPVVDRVAQLSACLGGWGANPFVERHARQVPYVVVCLATDLVELHARRLRDLFVRHAPDNLLATRGTSVQRPSCWLVEEAVPTQSWFVRDVAGPGQVS